MLPNIRKVMVRLHMPLRSYQEKQKSSSHTPPHFEERFTQRLYQDNNLPFKPMERGEVKGPVRQPPCSFAQLVYPVAGWLSGFQNYYWKPLSDGVDWSDYTLEPELSDAEVLPHLNCFSLSTATRSFFGFFVGTLNYRVPVGPFSKNWASLPKVGGWWVSEKWIEFVILV